MKKTLIAFGLLALFAACSESTTTAGTETVEAPISAEMASAGSGAGARR